MTPEDIRSQRFTSRLLHGLSPEEVSAFLEDVAEAFGNVQNANASLIERVKVLEAQALSTRDAQPAQPSPELREAEAEAQAQAQAESLLSAAREREASASSHIEVLRAAALREVEALLHDAQTRAQALLDSAQERDAATRQDAETMKTRVQTEAEELVAVAAVQANSLLVAAREQEVAIREEIDRLTQSRVQLVDDIRSTLDTYHQWLATMDPRGRARGRREAIERSNGDPDNVGSTDEARVG
jgi:DivIVA domain-containing protein